MRKKSADIHDADESGKLHRNVAVWIGIIAVLLFILIPVGSTYPDGLERVAENLGVSGGGSGWHGLFPDYGLPIGSEWLGTFLAGMTGVLIVLALMFLVAKVVTLRKAQNKSRTV